MSSQHKKNSVKWFKMFDKLITKLSNEGFASLPFQGLESGSQPSTLPFVSDSGHISKRKLLTDDQTEGPSDGNTGGFVAAPSQAANGHFIEGRRFFLVSQPLLSILRAEIWF